MRKLKNNELERISIEKFKKTKKSPIIIVLDNVRSALNVGSIFRTSDAFLIEKIILCGITAKPPNKNIQKTALGATQSVDWEYQKNILSTINDLKKKDYKIIVVEQVEGAIYLNKYDNNHSLIALVFGHEVDGVSQSVVDIADEIIEIPQFGTKHSLNISVSAGIVIWDLCKSIN